MMERYARIPRVVTTNLWGAGLRRLIDIASCKLFFAPRFDSLCLYPLEAIDFRFAHREPQGDAISLAYCNIGITVPMNRFRQVIAGDWIAIG